MTRGRTQRGRSRAKRAATLLPAAKELLTTTDHGEPVHVEARHVGASGERWLDPFLEANRALLRRLDVTPTVDTERGLRIRLTPGKRLGAVPLLSPSTRRVAAGLLVRPRFRWSALGAVMSAVGFETEPSLGQAPLVPGSAREVPPWLIAAPVLRRIEGLLAHRRREFVERSEYRARPRGRVDWPAWVRRDVPSGRWTKLPCRFPEPDDDPLLFAQVRWTLGRLEFSIAPHRGSPAGRSLHERIRELLMEVGPGESVRPAPWDAHAPTAWVAEALEAMGWVSEERGLGGRSSLDGLAWDLPVDELWESWVRAFCRELAPQLGLTLVSKDQSRRGLHWTGRIASMGSLVPDCILHGRERVVIVDAKYKPHLDDLARRGWASMPEHAREAHRADLHQALAYANLASVDAVDSVLVYPTRSTSEQAAATASLPSGQARVRVHLLGLPFGFREQRARTRSVLQWRERLL